MKIGITYLYIIYRYGYPHSVEDLLKGLPEVRKLGFRYLEMEGLGVQHMTALDRARKEVLARLADNGLQVHNFCVVDPNLVSLDARKRAKALEGFGRGAELGDFLGAQTLHLASYAPPVRYVDARPYELGKGYSFANTTRVAIPRGFDWEQVWSALVESCQACADIAAKHRMIVLMEPRVGETICSVDSMLRLIEHVGRPNFKANFDTGHFGAQRENVPLALEKLRGKFANIHIADNNPLNSEHLPIGDGVIDWREFFRVLKGMKYDGYLGLDLGARRTLVADYRKSVKRLRALASQLKVPMEV
ncbi:MAG: sugar phosphate isomerase/epimerase family protein [Bryobacteraceae bacterium]